MSHESSDPSKWLDLSADPDSEKDDCSLQTFKSRWKSKYLCQDKSSEIYSSASSLSQYSLAPDSPEKTSSQSKSSIDGVSCVLSEYDLSHRKLSSFGEDLSQFDYRSSLPTDLSIYTLPNRNSLHQNKNFDNLCETFQDISQYSLPVQSSKCTTPKSNVETLNHSSQSLEQYDVNKSYETKEEFDQKSATEQVFLHKGEIQTVKKDRNSSEKLNQVPTKDSKDSLKRIKGGNSAYKKFESKLKPTSSKIQTLDNRKLKHQFFQEKLVKEQRLFEESERLRNRHSSGIEKHKLKTVCEKQTSGSNIPVPKFNLAALHVQSCEDTAERTIVSSPGVGTPYPSKKQVRKSPSHIKSGIITRQKYPSGRLTSPRADVENWLQKIDTKSENLNAKAKTISEIGTIDIDELFKRVRTKSNRSFEKQNCSDLSNESVYSIKSSKSDTCIIRKRKKQKQVSSSEFLSKLIQEESLYVKRLDNKREAKSNDADSVYGKTDFLSKLVQEEAIYSKQVDHKTNSHFKNTAYEPHSDLKFKESEVINRSPEKIIKSEFLTKLIQEEACSKQVASNEDVCSKHSLTKTRLSPQLTLKKHFLKKTSKSQIKNVNSGVELIPEKLNSEKFSQNLSEIFVFDDQSSIFSDSEGSQSFQSCKNQLSLIKQSKDNYQSATSCKDPSTQRKQTVDAQSNRGSSEISNCSRKYTKQNIHQITSGNNITNKDSTCNERNLAEHSTDTESSYQQNIISVKFSRNCLDNNTSCLDKNTENCCVSYINSSKTSQSTCDRISKQNESLEQSFKRNLIENPNSSLKSSQLSVTPVEFSVVHSKRSDINNRSTKQGFEFEDSSREQKGEFHRHSTETNFTCNSSVESTSDIKKIPNVFDKVYEQSKKLSSVRRINKETDLEENISFDKSYRKNFEFVQPNNTKSRQTTSSVNTTVNIKQRNPENTNSTPNNQPKTTFVPLSPNTDTNLNGKKIVIEINNSSVEEKNLSSSDIKGNQGLHCTKPTSVVNINSDRLSDVININQRCQQHIPQLEDNSELIKQKLNQIDKYSDLKTATIVVNKEQEADILEISHRTSEITSLLEKQNDIHTNISSDIDSSAKVINFEKYSNTKSVNSCMSTNGDQYLTSSEDILPSVLTTSVETHQSHNSTQFEPLQEADDTFDMETTLVSTSNSDNNMTTDAVTSQFYDVNEETGAGVFNESNDAEEVQQAIMEISSDFIAGNLSTGNLNSEDSDSSHLSSDFENQRRQSSQARYPENASGLSDNDWNPYTTESDNNVTPRRDFVDQLKTSSGQSQIIPNVSQNTSRHLESGDKITEMSSLSLKEVETGGIKEHLRSDSSHFSPGFTSSRTNLQKQESGSAYFPSSVSRLSSIAKSSSANSTPNLSSKSSSILEFSPLLSSTALNMTHLIQQVNRFNVTLSDVSEATEHEPMTFQKLKDSQVSAIISDDVDKADDVSEKVEKSQTFSEIETNGKEFGETLGQPNNQIKANQLQKPDQPDFTGRTPKKFSADDNAESSAEIPNLNLQALPTDKKQDEDLGSIPKASSNTSTKTTILSSESIVDSKSARQLRKESSELLRQSSQTKDIGYTTNISFKERYTLCPENGTRTPLNASFSKSMEDLTTKDSAFEIDGQKKFGSTDCLDRIKTTRTNPGILEEVGDYLANFPSQVLSIDPKPTKHRDASITRYSTGRYNTRNVMGQSSALHPEDTARNTDGLKAAGAEHAIVFSRSLDMDPIQDRLSHENRTIQNPDQIADMERIVKRGEISRFNENYDFNRAENSESRSRTVQDKEREDAKWKPVGITSLEKQDGGQVHAQMAHTTKVGGVLPGTLYLEKMRKENPLDMSSFSLSPPNSPHNMNIKNICNDLHDIQKSLCKEMMQESDFSKQTSLDSNYHSCIPSSSVEVDINNSSNSKPKSDTEFPKEPQPSSDAESTDIVPSTTSSTPEKNRNMWDYGTDMGYDETGILIGRNNDISPGQHENSFGSRIGHGNCHENRSHRRRSGDEGFMNRAQVEMNAARQLRYGSDGEETRTSTSSGHIDGNGSDKAESEVTLTEQDIDAEPTRYIEENNETILRTINQRHIVDDMIESLRAQRHALEDSFKNSSGSSVSRSRPTMARLQEPVDVIEGLTTQFKHVLDQGYPASEVQGHLAQVFNHEREFRHQIFQRISDSSFSDSSYAFDESATSFDLAMDEVKRRLDLSNIHLESAKKPIVPTLDFGEKSSALRKSTEFSNRPYIPPLELGKRTSNFSKAESVHTTQFKNICNGGLSNSNYGTPKKHEVQCYPLYGFKKDGDKESENKYEAQPLCPGPTVKSQDPREAWPESGRVSNVTRGYETLGESNFTERSSFSDSKFTAISRTDSSLTNVSGERSQSDVMSGSGGESSPSRTDRRVASSPPGAKGESEPSWAFRHPEIPDLVQPLTSKGSTANPASVHPDEASSPSSPTYSSPRDSDQSGTRLKTRFRNYRSGGQHFTESDTGSVGDSITTMESTHTGSDDALGPELPQSALGSRPDIKQVGGIYSKQTYQTTSLLTEPALSTIEERSVIDEKEKLLVESGRDSTRSSNSDRSANKNKTEEDIDSGLYTQGSQYTESLPQTSTRLESNQHLTESHISTQKTLSDNNNIINTIRQIPTLTEQKAKPTRLSPFDDKYRAVPIQIQQPIQTSNSPFFQETQLETNPHSSRSKSETDIHTGRVSPLQFVRHLQVTSLDSNQQRLVEQGNIRTMNTRRHSPVSFDTKQRYVEESNASPVTRQQLSSDIDITLGNFEEQNSRKRHPLSLVSKDTREKPVSSTMIVEDRQQYIEEMYSRQHGRPTTTDYQQISGMFTQNEKPDYTGSRSGTNDEVIMKQTRRTERRKQSERNRPQYGHDSTSEEEYLRALDRTPLSTRNQRLQQALQQELEETSPQDFPALWQRYSEIYPSEAESQVNPSQAEIFANLVKNPTRDLIHRYFNERENSRHILEERHAEERQIRHQQSLNRSSKLSAAEDPLPSENFEQMNASYGEILEALAAERAKRLRRETKAKSLSRAAQKPSKSEKQSSTQKYAPPLPVADSQDTLYSIPEDQGYDVLYAPANSQSCESRDVVTDPMCTLKNKIRRQRDKIEKERRRELKRMEKLWKLEQLLKAKKSGLIGNFVLENNLNTISSTSTAASISESQEALSGDSTLTLSSQMEISEEMSTTMKDSSYEVQQARYEADLHYLLPSATSETLTEGEDTPTWVLKEEKKRRRLEIPKETVKLKGKQTPTKLKHTETPTKEKGRKILDTRPKVPSSPYQVKDRKHKSLKKPESFEISPVKWNHESTRVASPTKSSKSAALLRNLARGISPVKASTKSTRWSREPSILHHDESYRAHSNSPPRHKNKGVQTSYRVRSRSTSPSFSDLQFFPVSTKLNKSKHGQRSVYLSQLYSPESRENRPPKKMKKREKIKPAVTWYISLQNIKVKPRPLQERLPESQIVPPPPPPPPPKPRAVWYMNNDHLKHPEHQTADVNEKYKSTDVTIGHYDFKKPHVLTLQEALLKHKKDFISKSRERQKRIALAAEHRMMQDYLELERDRIFGDRKRKGKQIEYPEYKETLYSQPRRRLFTKKEMREITQRWYNRLPEVKYRELMEKRQQQYKINRLKALVFNRKVQNTVLRKAGVIA